MGELDCKGYAAILVGDVERIEGLTIQRKGDDDPDLYEIAGIPLDDTTAQYDYAIALAKVCGKAVKVQKKRNR